MSNDKQKECCQKCLACYGFDWGCREKSCPCHTLQEKGEWRCPCGKPALDFDLCSKECEEKYTTSTPTEAPKSWVEEFDNHWRINVSPFTSSLTAYEDTKSFISNLIAKEREEAYHEAFESRASYQAGIEQGRLALLKEIREKVEGMKEKRDIYSVAYVSGFNDALDKVLQLLKVEE